MHCRKEGMIFWLTGLSGAGKSTIAEGVFDRLRTDRVDVALLDGDTLRSGLHRDLGFSIKDRRENVRRAGAMAKEMAEDGKVVIAALISPINEDRDRIRASALSRGLGYYEIFVNAPLAVCELRDTKGLYRSSREGRLRELIGIDSPYEPPTDPELVLFTSIESAETSILYLYSKISLTIKSLRANTIQTFQSKNT